MAHVITDPRNPGKGPDVKAGDEPAPPHKDAYRKQYDDLMKKWGDSLTPASPDPVDTRKLGPPLTEEENKRLHELHGLMAQ